MLLLKKIEILTRLQRAQIQTFKIHICILDLKNIQFVIHNAFFTFFYQIQAHSGARALNSHRYGF